MPEIPDVPSIYDCAKTVEQRQLMRFVFSSAEFGRPYLFPPDVPNDRVQLMRRAMVEAVKDAEPLAEAAAMKLDMTYRAPDHLERLVADIYSTPPALIESVKKIVPNLRLSMIPKILGTELTRYKPATAELVRLLNADLRRPWLNRI